MIPQDYIYELLQRIDIVDVAQGYMQLRHRGRTYTGLCPFHNEKTPSFHIYPETQSFYCFGCGAGGDVISFVKKINNLDYPEAVKLLASRAGMPLPQESDDAGKKRSRLTGMNKDAARFFFQCLNEETGLDARRYWMGQRGLSAATVKRFGLGYAPDSFTAMVQHLKKLGYTEQEMLESGLVKRSQKGGLYDVFRNRVMVPIFDVRGNVIAFGGRNMGDEKPKYINSPETILYKKSRTIFGLNIAKRSKESRWILCEGYMDVISLHQAGFDTAVAACGTALTPEQVKLLGEYAQEVVLCYDSDEAGQKATERAIHLFENSPVKLSVLKLPGAKDPDEFLKRYGRDRLEMLLNGTSNALEYELSKQKERFDITSDDGRISYIRAAAQILAGKVTPVERDVYADRLHEETNVSKQAILAQIENTARALRKKEVRERQMRLRSEGVAADVHVPYGEDGSRVSGMEYAEQQLMAAVLKNPQHLALIEPVLKEEHFVSREMAQVYHAILQQKQAGGFIELGTLSQLLSPEIVSKMARILARNAQVAILEEDVRMYLERLQAALPQSRQAAEKTPEELAMYIEQMKRKK